jgi:hypothetical protein
MLMRSEVRGGRAAVVMVMVMVMVMWGRIGDDVAFVF